MFRRSRTLNEAYFQLPRPSLLLLSTAHHSSQLSIYTPTIPHFFFLVSPLHPTRIFLFFLFSQCRWETETIVALPHCVPRRRPSASNPLSPRLIANTIPSYMLAASLLSPVLPVGSVVPLLASWPGEHHSVIHVCIFPSTQLPSLLVRLTTGSRLLFIYCSGTGAVHARHAMRTQRSHGMSCSCAGASLSPHCLGFPHPSTPFLTPVLSAVELS